MGLEPFIATRIAGLVPNGRDVNSAVISPCFLRRCALKTSVQPQQREVIEEILSPPSGVSLRVDSHRDRIPGALSIMGPTLHDYFGLDHSGTCTLSQAAQCCRRWPKRESLPDIIKYLFHYQFRDASTPKGSSPAKCNRTPKPP